MTLFIFILNYLTYYLVFLASFAFIFNCYECFPSRVLLLFKYFQRRFVENNFRFELTRFLRKNDTSIPLIDNYIMMLPHPNPKLEFLALEYKVAFLTEICETPGKFYHLVEKESIFLEELKKTEASNIENFELLLKLGGTLQKIQDEFRFLEYTMPKFCLVYNRRAARLELNEELTSDFLEIFSIGSHPFTITVACVAYLFVSSMVDLYFSN